VGGAWDEIVRAIVRCDVLVIGAGIVGILSALHLQSRGQSVVLIDRRGPAEETSYGNAGIIQRESIGRYAFPRDASTILKYAFNSLPEAHLHWPSLPWVGNILFRYWTQSEPHLAERCARAMWTLTENCLVEHESLMERAGVSEMLRHTGFLKLFRRRKAMDVAIQAHEKASTYSDVAVTVMEASAVKDLEPHVRDRFVGAIFYPQSASVSDPGEVAKAYAALFRKLGGQFLIRDGRALEQSSSGWQLLNDDISIHCRDVVLAMGPWSGDLLTRIGIRIPLGVKRGYHMHFGATGDAPLVRPIVDADYGYVVTQMTKGIRLTTGVEFATRDAPPTPVQLTQVEPIARSTFRLGDRLDEKPWLGSRPFLPDLLPVIGEVPGHRGLWVNFGHHHLGFTTGPFTARLLADMMSGQEMSIDPTPYRIDRFS
jgi:D-amino-acid dehydrogenase